MIRNSVAFQKTERVRENAIGEKKTFPLEAVSALIDTLNQKGIRYSHWKSNSRLDWGLTGRTDLDLLVDHKHEKLFKDILAEQGIKKILAPSRKRYPELEHYLGFDDNSGKIFHLHVHYRLVLGEQFVKNYHLPIEEKFLDLTRVRDDVKVPIPALELIILSIRALLKYRDRDVVKDIFLIRSPGIPEHILDELLWLLDQTSIENIEKTLSEISLFSDGELILSFLEIIQRAPRSGWELLRLREKLRKELRLYQRQSRLVASIKYFLSLFEKADIFNTGSNQQLRFPNGGKLIAIVGIDGSGKSTYSSEISKWLEWKVSAPLYYLGSKQPSRWSKWSYLVFRIFRRSHTILSRQIGEDNFLSKQLRKLRQFFLAAHYLFVGVDRNKRYQLGKKQAKEGSIVIFDRFPFVSPLDGPEIHLISEGNLFSLSRKLSDIEKGLYKNFNYLDLLIVLNVDPEVSVERKPDHAISTIKAKHATLQQLKSDLSNQPGRFLWVSIDSNLSMEQVSLEIKRAVWSVL